MKEKKQKREVAILVRSHSDVRLFDARHLQVVIRQPVRNLRRERIVHLSATRSSEERSEGDSQPRHDKTPRASNLFFLSARTVLVKEGEDRLSKRVRQKYRGCELVQGLHEGSDVLLAHSLYAGDVGRHRGR